MEISAPIEKRRRNVRGEGVRLKDELVEAAMRTLDERPCVQLSLRMVAKEAGVAAPSVYRHFPDVGAMFAEIVRECWRQMGAELSEAAAAKRYRTPLGRLKAIMSAYVRYAMDRPSRYRLLFALSSQGDHDLGGPLRPAYRAVIDSIQDIAEGGGKLPAREVAPTTLLTLSLAHGRIALAHLAPAREGNSAAGVEAFVLETLDLLFKP